MECAQSSYLIRKNVNLDKIKKSSDQKISNKKVEAFSKSFNLKQQEAYFDIWARIQGTAEFNERCFIAVFKNFN